MLTICWLIAVCLLLSFLYLISVNIVSVHGTAFMANKHISCAGVKLNSELQNYSIKSCKHICLDLSSCEFRDDIVILHASEKLSIHFHLALQFALFAFKETLER